MKVNPKYQQYFATQEDRNKFHKLYKKLLKYSERQYNIRYFRGQQGGISPSGMEAPDFVIQAFCNSFLLNPRPFSNLAQKYELYNGILRGISRQCRLKINNRVKNEAYYASISQNNFNPILMTEELSDNARDQLIHREEQAVIENLVGGFILQLRYLPYKKLATIMSERITDFSDFIETQTEHCSVLMKELVEKNLIVGNCGAPTDIMKSMARPCYMNIDYQFVDKKTKSLVFGMIKEDRLLTKPRYIALYMNITENEYYALLATLRSNFKSYFRKWLSQGENYESFKELDIFHFVEKR